MDPNIVHNVVGVHASIDPGVYCVILDPSIDVANVAAVATVRLNPAMASTFPGGCSFFDSLGVQVNVWHLDGTPDTISSFYIVIP